MKKLFLSTTKVLKLSFLIVILGFTQVSAGGNDNLIDLNISDANAYANALTEMKKSLIEVEDMESILTPNPKIKIFDVNYNLVKTSNIPEDGIVEDREILTLLRQSSELMTLEHITFYILNK